MIKRIKAKANVLFGRSAAVRINKPTEPEKKFFCPVCKHKVQQFNPLPDFYSKKMDDVGYIHSIYQAETMNRFAYLCPNCGASDRDRLYALFISKYRVFNNDSSFHVLDIAPAKSLQSFIKNNFPLLNYRSADLYMEEVDDKVDITDMREYQNECFDFFICSHVLEHIEKDTLAMQELFRTLKQGGKGIAMVPILLNLTEDYENSEVKTPDERWKHFGQDDHVRFYSKNGFKIKLKNTGFKVVEYNVTSFGEETFVLNGIHKRSVLYIVEK